MIELILLLGIGACSVYIFKQIFCTVSNKISGNLIVSGKDSIKIALEDEPKYVTVEFEGDCNVMPCNPKHYDQLTWRLEDLKLIIEWDVSNIRHIAWTVRF